ncbi:MAG: DUF4136 domain-containing protein [bacterium]
MKATKFFLGLFIIAGLMGCSTALVKSDFDHDINFAGHQTFAWAAQAQKSDSDYYAQNALLEKRLQNAVERELTAKGFRKQTGDAGAPDFLITYRIDFDDKLEVISHGYDYWAAYYGGYWPSYYGIGFSYWPGYYHFGFRSRYYYRPGFYDTEGPYLREYKEVTLTLNLLNPETKELIWRGWYVDKVEDVNLQEDKIAEAVKRILEKFPPEQKDGHAPVRITLNQ